jgi:REP element-mobilizing transposase RayT
MPDHVHLFACATKASYGVRKWAAWWKRGVSSALGISEGLLWQKGIWDRRIYSWDKYQEKIDYVIKNPVRAGLVEEESLWPFQGMIHQVGWFD